MAVLEEHSAPMASLAGLLGRTGGPCGRGPTLAASRRWWCGSRCSSRVNRAVPRSRSTGVPPRRRLWAPGPEPTGLPGKAACSASRRGSAIRSVASAMPNSCSSIPTSLGGGLGTTLRAGLAVGITPRCIPPVESLGGARRVGGPPWCNPRWTTVAFGVNPKPRVTRRSAAPTGAAPARGRGRRPGCGWPRRACRGCGRRAF